jgi:hypothetical protein
MMEERRQLVARLRQIMEEAIPVNSNTQKRFTPPRAPEPLDPSGATVSFRRAAVLREIRHLAALYDWQYVVDRALVAADAPALKYLDSERLELLLNRLQRLEDCLRTRCDSPEAPHAS